MNGILYIVATPIGTLGDMAPRAVETLKSVDFLVCEDTRYSRNLCQHFGISTPLVSLHAHNEDSRGPQLAQRVVGAKAALITDAGTPGICDPGSFFVNQCHQLGIAVLSVPGPSALAAALASCGFRQPRALFSGFWPRDNRHQKLELEVWEKARPCVAVCFESPQRVLKTLEFFSQFLGTPHMLCVSRELSKKFEQHLRGSPLEVKTALEAQGPTRGEYVVCVDLPSSPVTPNPLELQDQALELLEEWVLNNPGQPLKVGAAWIGEKVGLKSKEVYNLWLSRKKKNS